MFSLCHRTNNYTEIHSQDQNRGGVKKPRIAVSACVVLRCSQTSENISHHWAESQRAHTVLDSHFLIWNDFLISLLKKGRISSLFFFFLTERGYQNTVTLALFLLGFCSCVLVSANESRKYFCSWYSPAQLLPVLSSCCPIPLLLTSVCVCGVSVSLFLLIL